VKKAVKGRNAGAICMWCIYRQILALACSIWDHQMGKYSREVQIWKRTWNYFYFSVVSHAYEMQNAHINAEIGFAYKCALHMGPSQV